MDLNKLNIYTISDGNGLPAHTATTQNVGADFTFYDMAAGTSPDWSSGTLNGNYFGEFEITSTDVSGSVGFLFFASNPPVAISGKIAKPNAAPIAGAIVSVPGGNMVTTDMAGNYSVPALNVNLDYELVPSKNTGHLEDISVTDLIRLSRHLTGMEPLNSPYQFIAADADNNANITQNDLLDIMNLLLGKTNVFPNNSSWRFVPQSYSFPDPSNPFTPPFPESISFVNLPRFHVQSKFHGHKNR